LNLKQYRGFFMNNYFYRTALLFLVLIFGFEFSLFGQGSPNVQLLLNFNPYPSVGYNDCWGYTAPDGREYALLGVQNGTSIVDITDPANASEIAFIPSNTSLWKDIKTYQHYAYTVTESGGGLQIIDLSNLPNSATLVNTYNGFSTSHNINIDEPNAILYAEGGGAEVVRVISLADPVNPVQISSFGLECHDIYARNNIAYISEGGSGSIGVYDLSTPGTPSLVTRINVPAPGYVHNAWLSDDGKYLMTTEETGGKTIKYWDIQNINQPFITDEVLGPSGLAHNAHVKGDYAYVSHYADGLRIYDVSDPNNVFEAGYYDTYAPPSSGFDGAWGAWPFLTSGKVLISDQQTGLYVVFFAGAAEADSLDPNPPTNLSAYSDYTIPNSMNLTWTDPTTLFGGNPISPSDFSIEIKRDDVNIGSVPGGTESYTDNGLNDGQLYNYAIYAKITSNDSVSREAKANWIAGGSPIPNSPFGFYVTKSGSDLLMHWTNPNTNDDDTPMDDLAGINLYENGVLKLSVNRTSVDSSEADSVLITPTPGTHSYYVTAFDSEIPSNESDPSNSGFSPLSLPFSDEFPTAPLPNSGAWVNTNAEVTTWGVNPPSTPNVLTLDGHPNGGDLIALLPVDLSSASGGGLTLSYWYQPAGTGNNPETGDSLILEFLNDMGKWKVIRSYPGSTVVPFVNEVIDIDSENPGAGATFFHHAFQFRFRSIGTSSTTNNFDLWLIDNVSFGPGNVIPNMVVTPNSVSDTLLVGETSTFRFAISNTQVQPSTLIYTVAENPPVDWLTILKSAGSVVSGQTDSVGITLDASSLNEGTYSTDIVVSGNDTNNPTETITVNLVVESVTGISDNANIPDVYALGENYPNPFNPSTSIPYQLPQPGDVRIEIYNMLGQKVKTLVNNKKEPGYYTASWEGLNDNGFQVSSGIYLYRIEAGEFSSVRKMILMK
jgi:choice-of-anchor B domain-containing protein